MSRKSSEIRTIKDDLLSDWFKNHPQCQSGDCGVGDGGGGGDDGNGGGDSDGGGDSGGGGDGGGGNGGGGGSGSGDGSGGARQDVGRGYVILCQDHSEAFL